MSDEEADDEEVGVTGPITGVTGVTVRVDGVFTLPLPTGCDESEKPSSTG